MRRLLKIRNHFQVSVKEVLKFPFYCSLETEAISTEIRMHMPKFVVFYDCKGKERWMEFCSLFFLCKFISIPHYKKEVFYSSKNPFYQITNSNQRLTFFASDVEWLLCFWTYNYICFTRPNLLKNQSVLYDWYRYCFLINYQYCFL